MQGENPFDGVMIMKINKRKIEIEIKRRGLKKAWIAEQLGISRQGLYYVLRDCRTFGPVEKLGKLLGINPKDLLD